MQECLWRNGKDPFSIARVAMRIGCENSNNSKYRRRIYRLRAGEILVAVDRHDTGNDDSHRVGWDTLRYSARTSRSETQPPDSRTSALGVGVWRACELDVTPVSRVLLQLSDDHPLGRPILEFIPFPTKLEASSQRLGS